MSAYERNRAKISAMILEQHKGRWIALAKDGSRVLASAPTLSEVEDQLERAGLDPEQAALEMIESEDCLAGGTELS